MNELNFNRPEKSIAVLPFVNMSDPEQEYFSDGITEEILNSLLQVKELHVAGLTSSFHFKDKTYDLKEVSQKLNVETVLEGSVKKNNNNLHITVQLTNVSDGQKIWTEEFERELVDIFAIQNEIALTITDRLKVTLEEKEKKFIQSSPTNNQDAYDLYLKGRFYYNKRGKAIVKAMKYFQQAMEKDAEFALAYTGLADSYCILSLYGIINPEDAMPKARALAEKAMRLHHNQAEAQTALAFVMIFYDWNWKEAKKLLENVLENHPNHAAARYWFSYYLSFIEGNHKEAMVQARVATEFLEPLVPISHHVLSLVYCNAALYDLGVEASNTAIDLDMSSYPGYRGLALNLGGQKKYREAEEAFKKAIELSDRQSAPMTECCWVYHESGKIEEVRSIYNELIGRSKTEYVSPFFICCLSWFMNDRAASVQWLEKAYLHRDTSLVLAKNFLPASFIKTVPELNSYLEKMRFPG